MDFTCALVLDFVGIKRTKEVHDRLVHGGAAALPSCRVACGTADEESASLRRKSWGPELTLQPDHR